MERYVIMKFKNGNEAAFLEIFMASKEKIASFDGCTHLELRRSKENPSWFMTFSLWEDESFLDMYRRSQLFKLVWGNVKPLFEQDALAISVWPEKNGEKEKSVSFQKQFGEYEVVWSQ